MLEDSTDPRRVMIITLPGVRPHCVMSCGRLIRRDHKYSTGPRRLCLINMEFMVYAETLTSLRLRQQRPLCPLRPLLLVLDSSPSELAAPSVRGNVDERFSPMNVGHTQAGRLYGGGQDTRALLTFYRRVDFESAE